MDLISFTVHGFKRFKQKSKINVDGKVVAIVGPNEAGKSSLLKAMLHSNNHDAFIASGPGQELTRGSNIPSNQTIVEGSYLLDDSDREAISNVRGGEVIRWLSLSKKADGTKHYISLIPQPQRDMALRNEISNAISTFLLPHEILDASEPSPFMVKLDQISKSLKTENETLPDATIEDLHGLLNQLTDDPQLAETLDCIGKIQQLIESETCDPPEKAAREILYKRIPKFIFFDEESRLLQSEYIVEQVKDHVPSALRNILKLARIKITDIANALAQQDHGKVETIIEDGNENLNRAIAEAWNQACITVRLRLDAGVLHILVKNENSQFVKIAERSDGLRQYLALMAFTSLSQTSTPPILLIDEAETHLHYDAQADLVQMFAKQQVASKVIFSTHSIGCLPEDLGTGVRAVEADSSNTSVIKNWFWEKQKPGFSPLLFSLGARTLAFIPVRCALIVEGMTEVILLPTLLRAATNKSFLGFQVVPGLSNASIDEITMLESQGHRTAYLVDSDAGGKALRSKLNSGGINSNRIFQLPERLVLEDIICPDVYAEAINEEIKRSHGPDLHFEETLLTDAQRPQIVDKWCIDHNITAPSKRAVAYRILDSQHEHQVLDSAYISALQNLYSELSLLFKIKN